MTVSEEEAAEVDQPDDEGQWAKDVAGDVQPPFRLGFNVPFDTLRAWLRKTFG